MPVRQITGVDAAGLPEFSPPGQRLSPANPPGPTYCAVILRDQSGHTASLHLPVGRLPGERRFSAAWSGGVKFVCVSAPLADSRVNH